MSPLVMVRPGVLDPSTGFKLQMSNRLSRPTPRPRPSTKCIKQTALLSHFLDVLPPNPSEMHSKNKNIEEKQTNPHNPCPAIYHMSHFWRATVHMPFLLSYHKQVRRHVFLFRFVPGPLSKYSCAGGSKFSFHYSGFSHFLLNFSGQAAVFSFLSFPPQFLCWTSSRRPAQMTRRRRRSEEGFTFGELLTWRNATICNFATVNIGMILVNS